MMQRLAGARCRRLNRVSSVHIHHSRISSNTAQLTSATSSHSQLHPPSSACLLRSLHQYSRTAPSRCSVHHPSAYLQSNAASSFSSSLHTTAGSSFHHRYFHSFTHLHASNEKVDDTTAAATAALAIHHITPQFICFLRAIPHNAPLTTPQSILSYTSQAGFDWSTLGGIAPRHMLMVRAGSDAALQASFTRMAGFPCHTAVYLTFPRHETRSPARVQWMVQLAEPTKTNTAQQVAKWGWRVLRYPNQIQINTNHKQRTTTSQEKPLTPRTLLSIARATNLPGWNLIDESMIHVQHNSSGWLSLGKKPSGHFAIKVPPQAKYFQAVADIMRTSDQLTTQLGWGVESPRLPNGQVQEVPLVPTAGSSTNSSSSADPTPSLASTTAPVTKSATAARPALVTPAVSAPTSSSTLSTSPAAATSPSPSSAKSRSPALPPSRFYFYTIDQHGTVFLEDEIVDSSVGGGGTLNSRRGLRDRLALNMMYRQLRVARELMTRPGVLQENIMMPVPIPPASPLAEPAKQSTPSGTLPMAQIPAMYPYVSLCAGELNFMRCAIVPIVYRKIQPSTGGSSRDYSLVYGGDLTYPFQPDHLSVDLQGHLFHPTPTFSELDTAHQGLISSSLAQEFAIREVDYSQVEVEYSLKQQESTRRLTLELQEEYQQLLETRPSELGGLTADQWIRARVQRGLSALGCETVYSRYVLEWNGTNYRIRMTDAIAPQTDVTGSTWR